MYLYLKIKVSTELLQRERKFKLLNKNRLNIYGFNFVWSNKNPLKFVSGAATLFMIYININDEQYLDSKRKNE